ncbi:MAG: hypothetical protein OXG71_07730, partial [Rhodospirillales bacterium]|nr:hypothetical protein [Rhodospirillales bacterium]
MRKGVHDLGAPGEPLEIPNQALVSYQLPRLKLGSLQQDKRKFTRMDKRNTTANTTENLWTIVSRTFSVRFAKNSKPKDSGMIEAKTTSNIASSKALISSFF